MPQQLTFTVTATISNPLSVTAPPAGPDPRVIPDGQPGTTYQCAAAGGIAPYTFTSPNLPSGWSLTAAGLLTRGSVGSYNFTITVTDSTP